MMPRALPEWIGKTPDTKVPDRVRTRVFERENGICHISKRRIRAGEIWHLEHKIPLSENGEHRESNLFPALVEPHKAKTRQEAKERKKVNAMKAAHILPREPSKRPIQSRGFDKTQRTPKPSLTPRPLYKDANA